MGKRGEWQRQPSEAALTAQDNEPRPQAPPLVGCFDALSMALDTLAEKIDRLEGRLEKVLYPPPPDCDNECVSMPGDAPMTCQAKQMLAHVLALGGKLEGLMERIEC